MKSVATPHTRYRVSCTRLGMALPKSLPRMPPARMAAMLIKVPNPNTQPPLFVGNLYYCSTRIALCKYYIRQSSRETYPPYAKKTTCF